jgi:DNA (cytosine-5)-methyltransferase 1
MRYLSVCSGIEAATQAWKPLGWKPVAFSEIEPFPSAVLKHHYPDVPNYGDMTKFQEWPDEPIDLLCGGTPCQSFSVAGLRKGLDDPRGNLMLTYGAIAARYRPRWILWENVPGVLSSANGRDFGSFLGLLTARQIEPPKDGWGNSGIIPGIAATPCNVRIFQTVLQIGACQ